VTDIAPGYDHIAGAIGSAIAGYYGADFLCYITPAEHLALPSISDVKEGLIAAKIAAHAADLARGRGWERDLLVAEARKSTAWDKQFKYSLDPEKAARYREERKPSREETCSMCGELCAIRMVKKYFHPKK
jgi:phosphomethylpyrimidine synthase